MTLYAQPVKGNFDDATNAILKTIHSDDEDELDNSTDDEEDDDVMIDNNQTITTIIRIIIMLTVINDSNFMIIIIRVSLIQRFAWPLLISLNLVHATNSLLKVVSVLFRGASKPPLNTR